ncbi:hypothetical protein RFI_25886 [Reticulomyxa filosa]|uniref:Uncharacterized protein n=1 Tax=Reticulomyxa filosa TaxID=46433 RepID=X6MDJ1_RETFI|nr:hypothetical protein RFI_25886 [Reticulomyxa filosa]|eukprot:ETO11487.1 hypothetical protein RFI_25886 [Reticulomyxa filosa]
MFFFLLQESIEHTCICIWQICIYIGVYENSDLYECAYMCICIYVYNNIVGNDESATSRNPRDVWLMQAAITEQDARIEELERDLEAERSKVSEARFELESKLDEMEFAKSQMELEMGVCKDDMQRLQQRIQELSRKESLLDSAQQENRTAQEELQATHLHAEQLNEELIKTQDQMQHFKSLYEKQNATLKKQLQTIAEMSKMKMQFEEEQQHLKDEFEQEMQEAEDLILTLEEKVQTLTKDNQELLQQLKSSESQFLQMHADFADTAMGMLTQDAQGGDGHGEGDAANMAVDKTGGTLSAAQSSTAARHRNFGKLHGAHAFRKTRWTTPTLI